MIIIFIIVIFLHRVTLCDRKGVGEVGWRGVAGLHCKGGLNQRGTTERGLAGGVDLNHVHDVGFWLHSNFANWGGMHNGGWELNMNGRGAHDVGHDYVCTNGDQCENMDGGGCTQVVMEA